MRAKSSELSMSHRQSIANKTVKICKIVVEKQIQIFETKVLTAKYIVIIIKLSFETKNKLLK